MRSYFRIIIALSIIWVGFEAIRQASGPLDAGLVSEFQYFPFIILMIATIIALVLETKYFKLDRKIYQYILSLIGVTLCSIVIFKLIQNRNTDNSKTILQVSNLPGANNVLNFEFKGNGRFRLTEYDRLGQTIYYGSYSKRKDTLNILRSNYNSHAKRLPQKGTIQSDTVYWNNFDIMLVGKE